MQAPKAFTVGVGFITRIHERATGHGFDAEHALAEIGALGDLIASAWGGTVFLPDLTGSAKDLTGDQKGHQFTQARLAK
jgi:hypothetical protein